MRASWEERRMRRGDQRELASLVEAIARATEDDVRAYLVAARGRLEDCITRAEAREMAARIQMEKRWN
jgi:hypothetical protein